MVEARPQVVMTINTTIEINRMILSIGMVYSFLETSLSVGVERRIVVGTLPI